MKKGKSKKTEKKYLSVVLVPHSSSQVKVLRFRALYAKLIAGFVILTSLFIGGGLYISKMLEENNALKNDLSELYNANADQRKLLNEKTSEIDQLKEESASFKEMVNDKIEEYTESFNKITDDYIKQQSTSRASRSGDRNEAAFSGDIQNLKKTLDGLGQLYSRSSIPNADLSAAEEKLAAFLDKVPTLWPTLGRLTDKYGFRKDPFTQETKFHDGIDIGADYGSSIKAAASGKVVLAERTSGYGLVVKVDHGSGYVTVYSNASKLLVKVGQTVKKGEAIAKVGSTGRSTGPHLHFEILLYGSTVDPLNYLDSK